MAPRAMSTGLSLDPHNVIRILEGQRMKGSCQSLIRNALTSLSSRANCRGKVRASEKIFYLSLFFGDLIRLLKEKTFLTLPSFWLLLCITLFKRFSNKSQRFLLNSIQTLKLSLILMIQPFQMHSSGKFWGSCTISNDV